MNPALDRIVVINDLSHPMGGASALAVSSARQFAERGYRVTLLSGDAPDPALGKAGIAATGLGQSRLLGRGGALLDGLWNRAAARMIRRWIAAHDTPRTVYHLHGWSQILSPSVFAALAPVRQRLVISAHDFFLACPNGAFTRFKTGEPCPHTALSRACLAEACDRRGQAHKLWRVARYALQRFAYQPQSSPPVLAIHSAMRPMLARAGIPAEVIQSLPNPVIPFSNTRITAERNDTLLFVGRIEATKGADLALAAARRASVPIILVGDGADRPRLAAEYPEAHFAGRLAPEAIGALAAAARMLVMPSRYPEPYGLVAMEAALAGLPVILPPTALLAADLVAAGAANAVYPQDIAAHSAVLAALARDDGRVEAMSRAGFTATRHLALSPEEWIDRLLAHYAARLEPGQATAGARSASGSKLITAGA
ncbi:polysaccharide biosynthesis protein [Novosphingobium sediminis]|uniref:Polysaccharide biosynthesis protein n=1 Tax=Novosphingobium sediminis TaxID=707214 RepID=A0A512AJI2_9SPHN|nr:glycosyltransferase family 4 protein [Novosphingobium sediminis]GEN99822.1 polysaccharide biosynthesis protein [Novosphingobium sediminis]